NGEQDEPATTKIDVMLVIDSSGSMNLNDPKEFRKVAAKEFVGALIEGDRAGVVDFDHSAEVTQELTTDFGSVNVTIESLD
ncbi:vWA domain-containing protein, partial [Salmonella enterica subsp. enterica serovar Enteritidis]|uniref:vWA domain-containing protein n=1 Tax=Salmonella enterica TaxID=28901 RepID=UPI0039E743D7